MKALLTKTDTKAILTDTDAKALLTKTVTKALLTKTDGHRPYWQKPFWQKQTERPYWQKQTWRPHWQKQTWRPYWQKQTWRPYWQKQTWRPHWQKQTCRSLSLNFWSCLLKIGVWKSQKHNTWVLPFCAQQSLSKMSWTRLECVGEVKYITNLFLIFNGKERTNMGVPQGAPFWSKTATSCV